VVQLELTVEDRKHMLRDITQAISDADTNLRAAEMHTRQDSTAVGKFLVEVNSISHLNRVIQKVRRVKGVLSVLRSTGIDAPD